MQMLQEDPEVLQMLHEIVNENESADELSIQADAAWLQRVENDAADA